MAHDADALKDSLGTLQDSLPVVPDKLKALLQEEATLRSATEELLRSLEEKQGEANELFMRLEVALAGIRRQATEQAVRLQQYPDFEAVLDQDKLDFEEKLLLFLALFMKKQQTVIETKKESMHKLIGFGSSKQDALAALGESLARGGSQVGHASDQALRGSEGLRNMVEASRNAISDEIEKVGAEIEAHRAASSRDVEQTKRDVEGFDAFFVDRLDLLGNMVRRDSDRMMSETQNRMADLRYQVSGAVEGVQKALEQLDRSLREDIEESAEARNNLGPLFENIEKTLGPLKEAIESVREAAHTVGIPF
jgi:predicted  nucleic acid-binding Zn-ribbon protein